MRRAVAADVRAVAAFQTRCWREAYAGVVPDAYLRRTGVADREVRWTRRIVAGERQVALAESAGELVGVVSWALRGQRPLPGVDPPVVDLPAVELCSLYVHPGGRSRGTGRTLLAYALGGGPAHLWVFSANRRAQGFYAREGFSPCGRTRPDPDTGLDEELWTRQPTGPLDHDPVTSASRAARGSASEVTGVARPAPRT